MKGIWQLTKNGEVKKTLLTPLFKNVISRLFFLISFYAFIITGCSKKDSVVTVPIVAPKAYFSYSIAKNNGYLPFTVNFKDSSTNVPTSYKWEFRDGSQSTDQNPTHAFTDNGRYLVKLTATNTAGVDTIIKLVNISGTKISSVKYTKITLAQPITITTSGGYFVMPELSKSDSLTFNFNLFADTDFSNPNTKDSVVVMNVITKNILLNYNYGCLGNKGVCQFYKENPIKYSLNDTILANTTNSTSQTNFSNGTGSLLIASKDALCKSCSYSGQSNPVNFAFPTQFAHFKENDEGYIMFQYQNSDKSFTYGWILINVNHTRMVIKGYAFQGTNPLKAGQ